MPKFSDIIGQDMIKEHLMNALKTGNISHAYIINGERYSGKEFIAKIFAMAIQCEKGDIDPCNECHACKQALSGNQPDIIHLTHEKPNVITVDDIREQINSDIVIKPYACDRKIYIINEAEKMKEAMGTKTPTIEQKVGNLSGGNQQKALLGKWMFTEPDILILDEPTRGIDVGAKYDIYCLINQMVANGKSVIMISSEMPELLGMCDRIYVMSEGELAGELTAEEATQEKIMACIMSVANR